MRIINISLGEEDYGNRWGLRVIVLGLGFFVGEAPRFRLVTELSCGMHARQWSWCRRYPAIDLGIWHRLVRWVENRFAGWRAP